MPWVQDFLDNTEGLDTVDDLNIPDLVTMTVTDVEGNVLQSWVNIIFHG